MRHGFPVLSADVADSAVAMPRSTFVASILTAIAFTAGIAALFVSTSAPTPPTDAWLGLLVVMSVAWGLLHLAAIALGVLGLVGGCRGRGGLGIAIAGLVLNAIALVPATMSALVWTTTAMLVVSVRDAGFVH